MEDSIISHLRYLKILPFCSALIKAKRLHPLDTVPKFHRIYKLPTALLCKPDESADPVKRAPQGLHPPHR